MLETIGNSETSSEETKLVEKDLEMLKVSTSASQEEPSGEECHVKINTFLPLLSKFYFEVSLHK